MSDYIYDPKAKTMVFTADTTRHVRVAFSDGKVWFAATDIAKLLGYRDPSKAANVLNCEVRILRVPHVSVNRRGITTCNCIDKSDVLDFINTQRTAPDVRDWILNVVIPQAERKLMMPTPMAESLVEPEHEEPRLTMAQVAAIMAALDKIIIEVVMLRRELQ